ncbi:hypothetical protein [Sphingomicrobium aestuariivivum]|nr:hypothetical protein [Sphingomicrobium aestuariivivum]MCJ8190910.1 hypothetical protein [Sphingomicrobium aestuariivivum]
MTTEKDEKAKRLAEALRANLRRRKGQGKEMAKERSGESKKPDESGA